jgi:hypothetical protein
VVAPIPDQHCAPVFVCRIAFTFARDYAIGFTKEQKKSRFALLMCS